jgi:recombination protein RecT
MNKNEIATVRLQLDTMREQFEAVLPKHIPIDRFARVVLTAIQATPELFNVDRRSLWNAAMKAAQDGLLPDGRLGAIVIHKSKRGPIATWMPMIAGIRQKVRNSGEIATWECNVVYAKDEFDYMLGDEPRIHHKPAHGSDRGEVVAAYSVATLRTGEKSREVMWADQINKIRDAARAQGGPWATHYEEMCRKTVAKRHAKVLPMSSDLDDLLRRDDDEDPSQVGPAVQPKPLTRPGMTDALNMLANLPDAPAPDDEIPADDETIEHDEHGEVTIDGR